MSLTIVTYPPKRTTSPSLSSRFLPRSSIKSPTKVPLVLPRSSIFRRPGRALASSIAWRDEVVPYAHSVRFADGAKAALHLLESDHRLHNQVRVIQYLFEYFLIALDLPRIAFE